MDPKGRTKQNGAHFCKDLVPYKRVKIKRIDPVHVSHTRDEEADMSDSQPSKRYLGLVERSVSVSVSN